MFVRSFLSRLTILKNCVREVGVNFRTMLCLDVATRWNSTYLILEDTKNMNKLFISLSILRLQICLISFSGGWCFKVYYWKHTCVFVNSLKVFMKQYFLFLV